MPLIAVTGGVAAGKSTFTRLLANALDVLTFDTDTSARRLLDDDAGVAQEIRAALGDAVFDEQGRVDRGVVRQIVFASGESRRSLEQILHPRVRAAWSSWAREELQKHPDAILIVQIPLLYETAADVLFDQAIVVGCARETQVRRLTTQRGIPCELAHQIVASQWSVARKARSGDRIIWNDGSPAGLQMQVNLCSQYYRDL